MREGICRNYKEIIKMNKRLVVRLFTDARVKYFGMSIAHGGKLPSFYAMNWEDFGLACRAAQLGFSPKESIGDAMLGMKRKEVRGSEVFSM